MNSSAVEKCESMAGGAAANVDTIRATRKMIGHSPGETNHASSDPFSGWCGRYGSRF